MLLPMEWANSTTGPPPGASYRSSTFFFSLEKYPSRSCLWKGVYQLVGCARTSIMIIMITMIIMIMMIIMIVMIIRIVMISMIVIMIIMIIMIHPGS